MSTRALIHFTDRHHACSVYRHWDGYPEGESGVIQALASTLPNSWPLPRFEADEFGAAFIATHKREAGGYRLCPAGSTPSVAFTYFVGIDPSGALAVTFFEGSVGLDERNDFEPAGYHLLWSPPAEDEDARNV